VNVAVIIPTFGHFEYAALAAESAARTEDVLIILMDDASPTWPNDRVVSGWIPSGVPFVIQRYSGNGGLSRSWNAGLRIARQAGCEFAVCTNSDVVFSRGWWEPLQSALDRNDFVGPMTNAPGHQRQQDVARFLPSYQVSDDPDDIDETARLLDDISMSPQQVPFLNGFCIAGRTESFFRLDAQQPFSRNYPLEGNEDDFFCRSRSRDLTGAVVPQSFVFHYRSVSRGLQGHGQNSGHCRIAECHSCRG
jgi:GT2 family glycosyltransferase